MLPTTWQLVASLQQAKSMKLRALLVLPVLWSVASGCGGKAPECKSVYSQIAECLCGNSRRNPDPHSGNDGCAYIDCETTCLPTFELTAPLPYTSSVPIDQSLRYRVIRASGPVAGDGALVRIGELVSMTQVAGSATQDATDPAAWVFVPARALSPGTVYDSFGDGQQQTQPRSLGRWSTESRPMVAGLGCVFELAERKIHLNIRFSEAVDPATVLPGVTAVINGAPYALTVRSVDAMHFVAEITDAGSLPETGGANLEARFAPSIATLDGRTLEPSAFGLATTQPDGSCKLLLGGLSSQRGGGYCVDGLSCEAFELS